MEEALEHSDQDGTEHVSFSPLWNQFSISVCFETSRWIIEEGGEFDGMTSAIQVPTIDVFTATEREFTVISVEQF